jgi:hypothetical protein
MIPTSSRAAALAGLALYAPCRRGGILAQRAASALIRLFGPLAIPGRRASWRPVMAEEVWCALAERWEHELGPFDELAGYRRMEGRAGMSLLLIAGGRPLAFIKVARDAAITLGHAREVLQLVGRTRPRSFSVPEPLASGEVDGWHYLALSPLPPMRHEPPSQPPLDLILGEIELALQALPRPADTPPSWRAMHGDFTPWNLRQVGRRLYLMDWDDANWGPPHADLVLYMAAEDALGRRAVRSHPAHEAIEFWSQRIQDRIIGGERNKRLARLLLAALARMRAAPGAP